MYDKCTGSIDSAGQQLKIRGANDQQSNPYLSSKLFVTQLPCWVNHICQFISQLYLSLIASEKALALAKADH